MPGIVKVELERVGYGFIIVLLSLVSGLLVAEDEPARALERRSRVEIAPDSGRFHALTTPQKWDASRTAVIVCDMWDLHHCRNAVLRVKELAPRLNDFVGKARRDGALIIHAPSSCMKPYEDHPARKRALSAPRAKTLPSEIGNWCDRIPEEERGEYPIDQSDGGEDDDPEEHRRWAEKLEARGLNPRAPWTRQIDVIEISDADAISDNGVEIWNLLEAEGRDRILLVGVHTNMCVLGRPFGLRQMARNGKDVALVRDLTDTMYNPARWPFVSHFTGTDLIVEHIEKWVCPTITSDALLGGERFRFSGDSRPTIVFVLAEREYETARTLPDFASAHLGAHFRVMHVFANSKDRNDVPGIEVVSEADLLVLSVRRRALPITQLRPVRKHVEAGKPLLAIRTSSHAFALRGSDAKAPEGHAVWPEFDADVLGGNYTGHHANKASEGAPRTLVRAEPEQAAHPILAGLPSAEFQVSSWLYKVRPLADSTVTLMEGRVEERPGTEPVAWTNRTRYGGRVFYTSLGHAGDFELPAFRRLLWNGIFWTLDRKAAAMPPDRRSEKPAKKK